MTAEAQKAMQDDWNKGHRGLDRAHKTAVLMGGVTPVPMSIGAKEGEFIGLFNVSRDQKLTALGVPPVIAGIFEYANYANSTQQMLIFYQHTIKPLGRLIADTINTQLLPIWYRNDPGLYVEFDYSAVDVLQEDRESKARIDQIYVQSGIKTPNEVRLDLSLPPVDGGDEIRGPSGGGAFGGLLSIRPPVIGKAPLLPTRADQWKARNADFIASERKLEKALAKFFLDQGDRVVTALDAIALLAGHIPDNVRALSADDLFAVFDGSAEDEFIIDAIMPVIMDIMIQAGTNALDSVGSSVAFNVADPRVAEYLRTKKLRVAGLNRITEKKLRDILVDASVETQSVSETSRQISGMFSEMSRTRADTIARTEVVGANNAAAISGYEQSGVVRAKEWLTSPGAEYPRHEDYVGLDGQIVPLDSMFDVGGWPMPGPGIDGPAEEVVNCRCTVLPVLED